MTCRRMELRYSVSNSRAVTHSRNSLSPALSSTSSLENLRARRSSKYPTGAKESDRSRHWRVGSTPPNKQRAVIHGNAARVLLRSRSVQWMLPDQNRVPRPLRVIQTVVGAPKINKEHKGATRKEMDRVAPFCAIKQSQIFENQAASIAAWLPLTMPLWEKHAHSPDQTHSHASVIQIDSSVRPTGGAGRPAAIINFRIRSPVSGCGMADCTPTRTSPSA